MRTGPQAYRTVTTPESQVTLDYADHTKARIPDVESVSVTRELPSGLPNQVVGGGGVAAATAEVTWAQVEDIRDTDVSPWRAADVIPQPGQPVEVWMGGDSDAMNPVFVGEVEDSVGGTGNSVSSSLVDHLYSRFHRQVSVAPKARWMYPAGEAAPYRQVGLTYVYAVDAIWRDCGYFTTPPAEYDTSVSLPLQGTAWAEYGTVQTATAAAGSPNSHASFPQADGRLYGTDMAVSVKPRVGVGVPRPITDGVQISVNVGADHAGGTFIDVAYGADVVQLRVTAAGNAAGYYNGAQVTTPVLPARGSRVSLLVMPDGTWQIRTSLGAQAGGTQNVAGATPMSKVDVTAANGARIAGLIVSHPNTPGRQHASLSFTQTAHIRPGGITHGLLDVHRSINSEKALGVLQEIANATCSQFRLDEDGHARWDGPGVLRGQSPVATITAANNLLSLAWRVSLDHVRASTTVTWDRPAISRSRWPKITFYEGRSETLTVGEELAEFIEVPSGEEWLGVHLPAIYAGANTGGDERINRGIGSVVGGAAINVAGDPAGVWFGPTYGSASIESVGDGKFLYNMVVNSLPAAESFATQMSPGGGGLWPKWDGQALPILRGYIKASWAQVRTTCQNVRLGDPNRPHLVHDGGPWVMPGPGHIPYADGDQPGKLADWIQQQCQTPVVEVTGCEIMPDTRLQLGDVINLVDPDNLAVALRVLITKITLNQSGPEMTQTLSLQVIAASPTAVTLDELKAAWAGADLDALKAAWTGSDLDDFASNPLEGSPHGD